MDPISVSIGIGLIVTLLFAELFGLAAGGMVVPGYVALCLNHPLDVVLTLATAWITFVIARGISHGVILYGKRRIVLTLLIGFLIGALLRAVPLDGLHVAAPLIAAHAAGASVIGFIIPGLIAIWIDRQGLVETFSVLLTTSVIVRLVLILGGMDLTA